MARVLGVDPGEKRIGIAVSDAAGVLASPLVVLLRTGNVDADARRIDALVKEEEAERVIVGLPVDLAGKMGIAAKSAIDFASQLATVISVPVETFDERMTTSVAHKLLASQGVSSKARRARIDKAAAAVMLQGWLDARSGGRRA